MKYIPLIALGLFISAVAGTKAEAAARGIHQKGFDSPHEAHSFYVCLLTLDSVCPTAYIWLIAARPLAYSGD